MATTKKIKRTAKGAAPTRFSNAWQPENPGEKLAAKFSHVTVSKDLQLPILHFQEDERVIICGKVLQGIFSHNTRLLKAGVPLEITYLGLSSKKVKGNYASLFSVKVNGKEVINPEFDFNKPVDPAKAFGNPQLKKAKPAK